MYLFRHWEELFRVPGTLDCTRKIKVALQFIYEILIVKIGKVSQCLSEEN